MSRFRIRNMEVFGGCPAEGGVCKPSGNETSTVKAAMSSSSTTSAVEKKKKVCKYWTRGLCGNGDRCSYLHAWFHGDGFSKLSTLRGHNEGVTGITMSSSMDKLYSSSIDKTVRVWDSHTGECGHVIKLAGEVGSFINEGPWVFAGLPYFVKAWNTTNGAEFTLDGPVGLVQSMVVANDMLFAGAQNGQILAWRGSSETTNPFRPLTSLNGHSDSVICFCAVGGKRLFSGSVDNTIRVWDLDTLQCVATLKGHTKMVRSLLYWNQYLLSCSLDGTIKVWATSQAGNIEVIYTHVEEYGAVAFSGIMDEKGKPILLCSYTDKSVRLFELPSFTERGILFGREEVWKIQSGPGGMFFTGGGRGQITVWKMAS